MENLAFFLLSVGAVLRLSRLIVRDQITAGARLRLVQRLPDPKDSTAPRRPVTRFIAGAVTCLWCAGVWVAFAVTAGTFYITGWPWIWYPFTALTAAWLAPVISSHLED